MKILLTGSSGRLGTELQKLRKFDYTPSHEEMDIADEKSIRFNASVAWGHFDLIVNCAAYTNILRAEEDRLTCYDINAEGVSNLLRTGHPILNISSEYAAFPDLNHYSFTKRLGEDWADKSLRLLFKPNPWPHEYAFEDQFTSGDYIDVIAREVNLAIDLYDHLPKVTNIGTGRKSMYDLAKQTKPDVKPNSVEDYIVDTGVKIPFDCSMDCSEWEKIKEQYGSHRGVKTDF